MGFGLNIFPANAAQKKSFTIPAATWTEISFLVEVKTVVPTSSTEGYILGFFNQTAADDVLFYVDNISFQKAVEYKEPAGNGGNAGGSNTGDVLPVAMIAVATISACGLVIVARRKRED